jgi:hypothetical protein
MEWWKDGILGMKSGWYLVFTSDACRMYINRPHSAKPSIPTFQYSRTFNHGKAGYLWPGTEDQVFNDRINSNDQSVCRFCNKTFKFLPITSKYSIRSSRSNFGNIFWGILPWGVSCNKNEVSSSENTGPSSVSFKNYLLCFKWVE